MSFGSPSRTPSGASVRDLVEDVDADIEFPSIEDEAKHYKDKYIETYKTLQEVTAELDDFQISSKELEQELENELALTEQTHNDLRQRIERIEGERDDWKNKYLAAQKTHNAASVLLQKELDTVRGERDRERIARRDLELGNDDLERNERMVLSSLEDAENRYNRAVEEKTLLEQELVDKQELSEENQRLKDEIRDLSTEIAVLTEQRTKYIAQLTPLPPPAPVQPIPAYQPQSFMSPVKEDSQELSLSDLVMSPSSPADSSFQSVASPRPFGTPSKVVIGIKPSATSPHLRTGIPSSPSTLRLQSSNVNNSINSPSRLSRSTTTRNISALGATPPTTAPIIRARINGRASPLKPVVGDSRSKGVQMVSDLGARVRTLQSKINTHNLPRARKTALTSDAGKEVVKPVHPRMRSLADESRPLRKESSTGQEPKQHDIANTSIDTPGSTAEWIMVSEGEEESPSPTVERQVNILAASTNSTASTIKPSSHSHSHSSSSLPSRPGIPSPLSASYNLASSQRQRKISTTAPAPFIGTIPPTPGMSHLPTRRPQSSNAMLSSSTQSHTHVRSASPSLGGGSHLPVASFSSVIPMRSQSPSGNYMFPSSPSSNRIATGVAFPSKSLGTSTTSSVTTSGSGSRPNSRASVRDLSNGVHGSAVSSRTLMSSRRRSGVAEMEKGVWR